MRFLFTNVQPSFSYIAPVFPVKLTHYLSLHSFLNVQKTVYNYLSDIIPCYFFPAPTRKKMEPKKRKRASKKQQGSNSWTVKGNSEWKYPSFVVVKGAQELQQLDTFLFEKVGPQTLLLALILSLWSFHFKISCLSWSL